ncbi:MAG: hypothetical protein QXS37_06065 [Candidatus Aenigmatarchaeota archaeon]
MKIEKIAFLIGLISILGVAFTVSLTKPAFSATSNQTNVTVEVKGVCQITVAPTNHTWFSVSPGSEGGTKLLEIKNSGSKNLTNIYGYIDTIEVETTNPIPTGDPSKYASGGLLVLNNGSGFRYVGRLEWNVSKPTGAGGSSCTNAVTWGWYRNATVGNYLWCMVNASDGTCNSTNAAIYIENEPDSGEPSTREPSIGGNPSNAFEDWAVYAFTQGPLSGHCVALYKDCTKIYIYKYDKRSNPNFGVCGGTSFIRTENLIPGSEFSVSLDVWVPKGIPAGWLASNWLTIEGSCPL